MNAVNAALPEIKIPNLKLTHLTRMLRITIMVSLNDGQVFSLYLLCSLFCLLKMLFTCLVRDFSELHNQQVGCCEFLLFICVSMCVFSSFESENDEFSCQMDTKEKFTLLSMHTPRSILFFISASL